MPASLWRCQSVVQESRFSIQAPLLHLWYRHFRFHVPLHQYCETVFQSILLPVLTQADMQVQIPELHISNIHTLYNFKIANIIIISTHVRFQITRAIISKFCSLFIRGKFTEIIYEFQSQISCSNMPFVKVIPMLSPDQEYSHQLHQFLKGCLN